MWRIFLLRDAESMTQRPGEKKKHPDNTKITPKPHNKHRQAFFFSRPPFVFHKQPDIASERFSTTNEKQSSGEVNTDLRKGGEAGGGVRVSHLNNAL